MRRQIALRRHAVAIVTAIAAAIVLAVALSLKPARAEASGLVVHQIAAPDAADVSTRIADRPGFRDGRRGDRRDRAHDWRHDDRYDRRYGRGYGRVDRWRGRAGRPGDGRWYGDRADALPAECLAVVRTSLGPRAVLGPRCLASHRVAVRALPGACAIPVGRTGGGHVWGARCLEDFGYRIAVDDRRGWRERRY